MRDPRRIHRIVDLICAYWVQCPDLRFFQLVEAIKVHISGSGTKDMFYYEDDAFEAKMNELVAELFESKKEK